MDNVNESISRLENYVSKFFNSKEKKILLNELLKSCLNLKVYADSISGGGGVDSEEIEKLNNRINKANEQIEALVIKDTIKELNEVSNDVSKLEEVDNELTISISGIKEVDNEIKVSIENNVNDYKKQTKKLKDEDIKIKQKNKNEETEIINKCGAFNKKVNSLDVDKIKADIIELEKEDGIIKEKIDSHLNEHEETIEGMKISIDDLETELVGIRNELPTLVEKDEELVQSTSKAEQSMNEFVKKLKTEDTRVETELTEIKINIDDVETKLVETSKTPVAGKAPLGLADGKIDKDWLP